MAFSPFKTPQSPLNRSRSSSCSSPVRNRIVYQEVYSIGSNTLVRSYSCDQVFDKDDSGRTFQTTQIQFSSFITPEKANVQPKIKPKEARRLALEAPAEPASEKIESKQFESEPSKPPKIPRRSSKSTMIITSLTVLSAYALYYYFSSRDCGYIWDLERTEIELKENIFGQTKPVERINGVLKMCNNTVDIHVMVFTGGIGVGKTYASSIISRNFPWSSKKLISYSEYFNQDVKEVSNQKLSTCGCNFIIVDGLSVKSVKEANELILLLKSKRKQNENLLLILIFQTQTEAEKNAIADGVKSAFHKVNFVPFQPLSKEDVEKCYHAEIKRQGVYVPSEDLKSLVEEKMKHVDVVKGPTGCKGVAVEVASYYKN